jgi:hypothetical protein
VDDALQGVVFKRLTRSLVFRDRNREARGIASGKRCELLMERVDRGGVRLERSGCFSFTL